MNSGVALDKAVDLPARVEPREIVTFLHRPSHRVFQIAFKADLEVGALAELFRTLGSMGIKIINTSMCSKDGRTGSWSVFLDSQNFGITSRALRARLETLPLLRDLQITQGDEFVVDELFFPITDPLGNRVMIITQWGFQQMIRALNKMLGTGEGVVLYQAGVSLGSTYAAALRPVFHGDPRRFVAEVTQIYTAVGIGVPEFVEMDLDRLHFVLRFAKNIECEGESSEKPHSQWLRGMLAGGASTFLDTPLGCRETRCIAMGDPHCEFEISTSEG